MAWLLHGFHCSPWLNFPDKLVPRSMDRRMLLHVTVPSSQRYTAQQSDRKDKSRVGDWPGQVRAKVKLGRHSKGSIDTNNGSLLSARHVGELSASSRVAT